MRSLLCALLFSLLCIVVCPTPSAAMPQLLFRTEYKTGSTTGAVYTSARGVHGESSPFILMSNNNLQSFSANGTFLRERHNFGIEMVPTPVMNLAADSNTLLIAPNTTSVIGVVAETLETKWMFTIGGDCPACDVAAMVYVEPELVTSLCPSGAGGVSLLLCSAAHCNIRVLDFHTGKPCNTPVSLPSDMNSSTCTPQGFPSGKALKSPMVVAACSSSLYGVDAISGHVAYNVPYTLPATFDFFLPGSSLTNELFAFFSEDDYNGIYYSIYHIADGTLQVAKEFSLKDDTYDADTSAAAWSTTEEGIVLAAYPQYNDVEQIIYLSAKGEVHFRQKLHAMVSTNFVNGNGWTMAAVQTGDIKVKCTIVGYPAQPTGASFASTPLSYSDAPFVGLSPFTFVNGSAGMVGYYNADPNLPSYIFAYLL